MATRTSGSEVRAGETDRPKGRHRAPARSLLPGQGVGQRPRVGQAPSRPGGHRVHAPWPTGSPPATTPERLQAICDRFGPDDVQAFFDRWIAAIPTPFTAADRAAGYWWELSMRQVEVSRTLVFDDPRRARGFFEALVADNIGIGRPDQVAMVFARQVRTTTKDHRSAPASSGPAPR